MKLNYKQTMLIGLGFFTVSIVWGIYNIAMPIYLDDLGLSGLAVGAVMTIDNIFAVIFLPIFGALSDRTNTRYGRRMPYLLVGIPLSALAFILIPVLRMSLLPMMITVIAMNFFMSIYRAPTVALMPDFTPRPLRSKANGVINFMGGVGAVIAFLIGGFLFRLNEYLPFAVCSGIMMLTIIVMYLKIREPMEIAEDKPDVPDEGTASVPKDKGVMLSLIFLLLAIFFWFVAYNAVETFFSTFGEKVLGIDKSQSSFMLSVFSAMLVIFSIPSGFIASRIGRKRTILIGITVLFLVFAALNFAIEMNTYIIYILLAIGGISWALININSYPMVVEMASNKGIGKYTGYYYFFSMTAAILSPVLFGFIKDLMGDSILFIYSSIAMVLAFFFMMLVKHGESEVKQKASLQE
ncbi:MAG: SLC45 family MFS transporter [Clostridiaceae bacterium]|jgi:maltose/moltooligosaccharide transporter|nr:MFS transporter [Bacillota bacterium]NLP06657.1 SLC45 family MFS transporter [Clostridiaceae bacterium]HPZ06009.1 MFS transporter [Clostridiales bacterium]HQD31527.1 MFS transporter [Clostridiales bacterium]